MKKILFFCVIVLFSSWSIKVLAQTISSRNGFLFPVKGEVRLFLIFAEVINQRWDQGALAEWQPGQMPPTPNAYKENIEKYFREASFGDYNVVVDYYPELIQVDSLIVKDNLNTARNNILLQLGNKAAQAGKKYVFTADGRKFPEDFDQWTIPEDTETNGTVKINAPDGKVDFIVFLFRTNNVLDKSRGGGNTWYGISYGFMGKTGYNGYTQICSRSIAFLTRHEFTHSIVGGNEFHSGDRGAGKSNYLHNFSGYGLISSSNCSNSFCSGWDRYRLGWKHPEKNYYIGAINPSSGNEVATDLVYAPGSSAIREYIIRDFTTYGDVVRIKLPYIPSPVNPQWIWLENHQPKPGTTEYKGAYSDRRFIPKGMYVNYQVGNEDFSVVKNKTSRTNYYSAENSVGNYDIREINQVILTANEKPYEVFTEDSLANPFTGYNFMSAYAYDNNNDGVIQNTEENLPYKIRIGSYEIPASDCHYRQYLTLGSRYDAFVPGESLSMTTNPAPVPRLTFQRNDKRFSSVLSTPDTLDNRKIYLNGLSIQMLEQHANGDIRVRVRYNDFNVKNNVRWCGDMVLNEKIIVNPSCTLLLDQGLSATRPTKPVLFQGKRIFADPTYLTCNSGSTLTLQGQSRMILKNNSSLTAESGSILSVTNAHIDVEAGSTFRIRSGSRLNVSGDSFITIKKGAYLCIEPGAIVNLSSEKSCILLEEGSRFGVNTSTLPSVGGNYLSSIEGITYTGQGAVAQLVNMSYLQNESLSAAKKIYVKKAKAGSGVTTTKPSGEYKIKSGGSLTVISTEEVHFEDGFTIEEGGAIILNP